MTLCLIFFCLTFHAQQTCGLFLNDADSFQGYTLFGNNTNTYLIDNCGLVVNSWESTYRPAEAIFLLENGNLLRTGEIEGTFNAGGAGGIFELFDWNGNLIWSYAYHGATFQAHHDIEPLPNGNFLALVWELIPEEEAQQNGRIYNGDVWSEKIVELKILPNNQAQIIWEWRLFDHLVQDQNPSLPNYGSIADHPELININFIGEGHHTSGNWIHLNSINYNAELEQILVSSRLFSEVWIIDHSTTTAQAASHSGGRYGKGGNILYRFGNPQTYNQGTSDNQIFKHQHDAQWITEGEHQGKLMVFNNDNATNESSIEIWSPPILEDGNYLLEEQTIDIELTNLKENFYSQYMSSVQYLPNGNLLVCEGMNGYFFEVNPDLEIVWEYINPCNLNGDAVAQGGTVRFNQCFRATRYAPDYPAFDGKNLEASNPVEINPWESDCFIPKTVDNTTGFEIELIQNPVHEILYLQSNTQHLPLQTYLVNNLGQTVLSFETLSDENNIDLPELSSGIYFIVFEHPFRNIQSLKVVVR